MSRPTIAVVDDHAGFRRAARRLAEAAGAVVSVEADGFASVVEASSKVTSADLVIMDINLGDGSGIDLTRRLLASAPELRVVLVSSMNAVDLPADAADCGALTFVPKSDLDVDTITSLLPKTRTDL